MAIIQDLSLEKSLIKPSVGSEQHSAASDALSLVRPCVRDLENENETALPRRRKPKGFTRAFEVPTTGLKDKKLAILERKQTDHGFARRKKGSTI